MKFPGAFLRSAYGAGLSASDLFLALFCIHLLGIVPFPVPCLPFPRRANERIMKKTVLYVPALHRRFAPENIPGDVVFFPCGIEGSDGLAENGHGDPHADSVAEAVVRALPLKGRDAAAALDDMLRMGEEYSLGGMLRQLAAREVVGSGFRGEGDSGEFADLAVFARTGILPEKPLRVLDWNVETGEGSSATSVRRAVVDCQKVLLLVWSREERLLELSGLEERFQRAESALKAALGESDAEELPTPVDAADTKLPEVVPWRIVLDAVLPFLPEDAVLLSADETMAAELRDAGMLQPLPEDRAVHFREWPGEVLEGLMHVCLPAWRLAGRSGPLADRPWLEREVELFVSRPSGSWSVNATDVSGAGVSSKNG